MAGVLLGEVLVHGFEIARAEGLPWTIEPLLRGAIDRCCQVSNPICRADTRVFIHHCRYSSRWFFATRGLMRARRRTRWLRVAWFGPAHPVHIALLGEWRAKALGIAAENSYAALQPRIEQIVNNRRESIVSG